MQKKLALSVIVVGVFFICKPVFAEAYPPDALTLGSYVTASDSYDISGPSSRVSEVFGYSGPITVLEYHMQMSGEMSQGFSALVCSDNPVNQTLPYLDGRNTNLATLSDKPTEDYTNGYPWFGIQQITQNIQLPCRGSFYIDNTANSGEVEWSIVFVPRIIASSTPTIGDVSFEIAVIIVFIFIGFVGYVFNHLFSRKSW